MRTLCVCDGVNQPDLAARAGQERNNLSRTLNILESKCLVRRKACATDSHNILVYIIKLGRRLHAAAYQVIEEYRAILFKGFPAEEIEAFTASVHRLTANLEQYLSFSEQDTEQGRPPDQP